MEKVSKQTVKDKFEGFGPNKYTSEVHSATSSKIQIVDHLRKHCFEIVKLLMQLQFTK